jgi:diguanylate cyclase
VGEHSARVQNVNEEIAALSAAGDGPLRASLLTAARRMSEANQKLQAELAATKAELHEHARRIEVYVAEARTDALTGVANRRALDEELARRYAAWQRQGTPFAFFIIDVDRFKTFNDTHGHQAGDAVLRTLGRVLRANARDMDFVARYGGEEFAFVLAGTQIDDAKAAAERVRKAVAEARVPWSGESFQVTVSVGLAELQSGDTVESLLKHADTALYTAKSNGRNRTYYYDGRSCLPVDLAAVAARSAAAALIRDQSLPVDSDASQAERRHSPRHKFERIQRIAPYRAGRVPAADEFHDVRCRDISAGGFSFWLPSPPDYSALVIALGQDSATKYLIAEVVRTTAVQHGDASVYLVGCRFTGRLNLVETPREAAIPQSAAP